LLPEALVGYCAGLWIGPLVCALLVRRMTTRLRSAAMPDKPRLPPFAPALRTQIDVERFWTTVMRPLGWSRVSLWLAFAGTDGVVLPFLEELADVPDLSVRATTDAYCERFAAIARSRPVVGRFVLLYSRPGEGRPTERDRETMRTLGDGLRRHGVPHAVLHIATDTGIYPMAGDDVLAA